MKKTKKSKNNVKNDGKYIYLTIAAKDGDYDEYEAINEYDSIEDARKHYQEDMKTYKLNGGPWRNFAIYQKLKAEFIKETKADVQS